MDRLVVENLEKYFPPARTGWGALLQPLVRPTVRALAGVSLRAGPGEALAVIGANGAGKSTLLRILATLLLPTRGRARVAGFDVESKPEEVRRQLGYHTSSDGGFYARLTARENLGFFAALNNVRGVDARQKIARVTDLLGLGEALDRPVRTLSTGAVNRLGMARALLHAPAVLLLDEPTRSLDPLAAAEVRQFLRREVLRQQGVTLLFTTHSLSEAEEVADRVAILHEGRLLACETPRALQTSTGAASLEQVLERLTRGAAVLGPAP